jgi:hypothetical protein
MTLRQSLVPQGLESYHTLDGSLILNARHETFPGEIYMGSNTASDGDSITAGLIPRRNPWRLTLALCALAFFNLSCSEEKPPEPPQTAAEVKEIEVEVAPPPTYLRINTLTLQNTSLDGQRGTGYADMYAGTAHGGKNASDNADQIDFRHQYRGRDIGNQRSFENMTTKKRWDRTGLFTNVSPTESKIVITSLDVSSFDLISNDEDLVNSFEFRPLLESDAARYRRAYLSNAADEPTATVFAFIDKKGRRGLFKVLDAETAPIDTVSEGMITIVIKVEDRQG